MDELSRDRLLAEADAHFDDGGFLADLTRRVAIPTSSRESDHAHDLYRYLEDEIAPTLARLGYEVAILDNPLPGRPPFLLAERQEDPARPTVLTYGHGDVVPGLAAEWHAGLAPWSITVDGDRWYGRGTADNKGQHSINLAALGLVSRQRGRLGFNSRVLIEMGEEVGSPGLREFCTEHRDRLTADLLIGSDGPRFAPDRATVFGGTRGALNFDLTVELRDGGHHSGNWGGVLANPGTILMHALASMVGRRGEILVAALRPPAIPNSVRMALADCRFPEMPDGPEIDPDWGEPGLTPVERVYAWNTLEILAFETGHPDQPVNAVPPRAKANCQIRFTVDTDPDRFLPAIRAHLDQAGFGEVQLANTEMTLMRATRLDPDHPAARWAQASIARTLGTPPVILPNLGGSLPNDIFTDLLAMPTVWVPHSYNGCSQHAANEHLLAPIVREGLRAMAGLFWDLGEADFPLAAIRAASP